MLYEHIIKENKINDKLELWKRAWITLLNQTKLYNDSNYNFFPDYSYLFEDIIEKIGKVKRINYDERKNIRNIMQSMMKNLNKHKELIYGKYNYLFI